jgi:hypothetical protein
MFKPGCSVCNLNAWFVAVCKPEDLAHRFEPIVAYSSSLLTPPYPEISHRMRDQWRETRREVGTAAAGRTLGGSGQPAHMSMKSGLVTALGLGAGYLTLEYLRRITWLDLRHKIVLITGGSRGLGLAMAREFGSRGVNGFEATRCCQQKCSVSSHVRLWLPGMDSNQGLRYDAVADEL